jgi:hypothetical protein
LSPLLGMLCNNIMRRFPDPLALSASATARLGLAGLVAAGLWGAVAWALAR